MYPVLRIASLMTAVFLAPLVDAASPRGAIAFRYEPLSAADVEHFSRYDVLVTHDPLPPATVETLRAAGTRLVLYEWAVAFYASLARPESWHAGLLASRSASLLNQRGLRGGVGAADADAYYYDPASPEHQRERAREIAARLRRIGYDGVFFDTTTAESVHPVAMAEFRTRHEGVDYDEAFSLFLRNLRRELSGGLIITNQGYRRHAFYLPYADWDVSESLITRPKSGRFVFRPWNDPRDPWNSIAPLMRELIAPVRETYPHLRFVHINYLDRPNGDQAAAIVAIARLYGDEAFVAVPSMPPAGDATIDWVAALGAAIGPAMLEPNAAHRWFEGGLVAVNVSGRTLTIANRDGSAYVNAANGRTRSRKSLTIPASGAIPATLWLRKKKKGGS